ncbi:hypothetical protein D9Q98_009703 [Chlorella vulgaris]|uniref:AAA+ ATPase domain-containing protein n=1 Tax=Chlorella vulgaris TaxID=3077 RepID=A0A9D4TEX4_CHLVU|nr:hypothetical protein D9Q98_009703 [Chlorella vulgaris]
MVDLLPQGVRQQLLQHPELPLLLEVVMDLGRAPLARFPSGDVRLAAVDEVVTEEQLQYAVQQVGEFGGDNRAGIDKTLHRISCIRNRAGRVVGLTCRVGRAISGSAAMVADLARSGKSILLLGRPGVGKTTAIREISRLLADDCERRVVIVDTSNEIGGDGDIPHGGIGRARRMQVPQPEAQHRVMIEAVENHMPEVIVIDEIGTEAECLAARTIAQRGVQLVATAHGNELENVMKNPSLSDLVGGISSVTLGDEEAKRRGVQKSVLERQSPPTFDACVEMVSREQWRVHVDVGWAVDSLLVGKEAGAEVRERDDSGKVWSWPEGSSADFDSDSEESEAAQRRGRQRHKRQQVETQPFPVEALSAARMGAALQAAEEAGVPLPLVLRAAAAGSSQAGGSPRSASSSSGSIDSISGGRSSGSGSGKSSSSGGGSSSSVLHVFPFGIDGASIRSILESLGLTGSLVVADRIQDADTVLALRSKIKTSSWIKEASKAAGIPMYSVKTAADANLVRAVRTLLGIDPSPSGAMFTGNAEAPAAADPRAPTSNSRTLRAETSLAMVAAARSGRGAGTTSPSNSAADAQDALEEARLAAEQIVIPRCQPVELLPRELGIISSQVQLVEGLGLPYEVVGSAASLRLRVLPPAWASSGTTSGRSSVPPLAPAGSDAAAVAAAAAAAAVVEGAVGKEFW